MKVTNGKILIFLGIIHPLLGVSPFAFGKQFAECYLTRYTCFIVGIKDLPNLLTS